MQQNDIIVIIVPKTDILVLKIKVLLFWGDATKWYHCDYCPENWHSCFENKSFAVLRGCNKINIGCAMSQNEQNIYFQNKNVRFRDMQHNNLAQNAQKLQKPSCDSPQNGHSCFENKCFAHFGTCHIMSIFGTCAHVQFADMQYAHKKMKFIRLPNLAKMLSFVIILLSSRDPLCMRSNGPTSFGMRQMMTANPLVGFAKFVIILLSFCYHCYW